MCPRYRVQARRPLATRANPSKCYVKFTGLELRYINSYFAPLDEGPRVVGPDVLARPLFGPFSRRHPKSHASKKICG